ncbi:unnamed protein product, partial [Meganyctiphanes norvegica]
QGHSKSKRGAVPIFLASAIGHTIVNAEKNTHHLSYSRNFQMTVKNYLNWTLQDPGSFIWYGHISTPPSDILSCTISDDAIAGHKTPHRAEGTSGIVSWKIKENNLTVIVLWSVPYSSGCNSVAVGLYRDLPSHEPKEST